LALDEKVSEIVAALKARGFQSPYLRQFVAARINPIRFAKTVEMTPEELLDAMMEKAEKFDVGAVKKTRCRAPAAWRRRRVGFDPQGTYVRRWLPELAGVPDKHVHRPWDAGGRRPIVDHAEARQRFLTIAGAHLGRG
jgi:hypothetical protein